MKIIGGHDYYDSALGYGQDDQVVFVRGSNTINTKECPLWCHYPHDISTGIKSHRWTYGYDSRNYVTDKQQGELWLRAVSVYVAGVRYGGVAVVAPFGKTINTFWDYQSLEAWLEPLGRCVFKPKKEIYSWATYKTEMQQFPDMHAWFERMPASPKELDYIISNNIVTAVACSRVHGPRNWAAPDVWHINSADPEWTLKEISFAKVMDPYALFQELSMFVGGVLPKDQPAMVAITDADVKIAKHGFNKWSFRKHKEDPKAG